MRGAQGQAEAQTMNHHYLKSMSIEVGLANAGFNAKYWNHYVLPRSRGGSLHDVHVKRLIEFIFPGLLHAHSRAQAAWYGSDTTVFASETNFRFTEMLIHLTFFWLQDAVVLLTQYPEMKDVSPWNMLLHPEVDSLSGEYNPRSDFHLLGAQVMNAIRHSTQCSHTELLAQQELIKAARDGATAGVQTMELRLSQLPGSVADTVQRDWLQNCVPQIMHEVESCVQQSLRRTFREMYHAASFNAQTAAHVDADSPRHSQCPHASTPTSASKSDFGAARPCEATQGAERRQGNAYNHSTNDDEWCPPIPSKRVPMPEAKRRRSKPERNSLVTRPTQDGYFLGNDLHTISEVYELKQKVEEYTQQNGNTDWHLRGGDEIEKKMQKCLRERRRLLWIAIQSAAKVNTDRSEADIVHEVQEIQDYVRCGITKVELWARQAKKDGCTIIEVARCAKRKMQQALESQEHII